MDVSGVVPLSDTSLKELNSPRLPRNSSAKSLTADDYAEGGAAAPAKPANPLLLLAEASSSEKSMPRALRRRVSSAYRSESRASEILVHLATFFRKCPHPTAAQLNWLASHLQMNDVELEVWFNNRRLLEQWVAQHPGLTPADVARELQRSQTRA